jgi:hypothetical protein
MTVIAGALILLANLAVFGLSLKLYTEYVKDRAQDRRAASTSAPPRGR